MDGSYFLPAVHGVAKALPKTIDGDMKGKKRMDMNVASFTYTFTNTQTMNMIVSTLAGRYSAKRPPNS